MPYSDTDYWRECITIAADECDLKMTAEQLAAIADNVSNWHENYGLAFYSPPNSDFVDRVEREWQAKFNRLQAEFDRYKGNAEKAVGRALRIQDGTSVSIEEYGSVFAHGGRTTQIQ